MLSEPRKAAERLIFKALVFAVVFWALLRWLPMLWDKLSPFIIAIPIAAMLQPLVRFCHRRLKLRRSVSSLILVLLLIVAVIFTMIWLVGLLVEMVNPFLDRSGDIVTSTIGTVKQAVNSLMSYTADNFSPNIQASLSQSLNEMVTNAANWDSPSPGRSRPISSTWRPGFPSL